MPGLLVLLFLGTGTIFLLQNRQPVVLYFLGHSYQTALLGLSLPLGVWVLVFWLLGILTGFILPLFYGMGQPSLSPSSRSRPSRPRPSPPEPPPPPPTSATWDWNPMPELEDWVEPEEDLPSPPPPPPLQELEAPQVPQKNPQVGTVYSYTYEPASGDRRSPNPEPQTSPQESVYTAPYRVLSSPPEVKAPEPEEEDWV